MPLASVELKEDVEKKQRLLVVLEAECSACDWLKEMTADEEYIYQVYDMDWKPKTAILAVAQYNNDECPTYALYAPTDLPEEQLLSIFYFFLREVKNCVEPDNRIIVFSKRDYDAIMKYPSGKPPADVLLYNK